MVATITLPSDETDVSENLEEFLPEEVLPTLPPQFEGLLMFVDCNGFGGNLVVHGYDLDEALGLLRNASELLIDQGSKPRSTDRAATGGAAAPAASGGGGGGGEPTYTLEPDGSVKCQEPGCWKKIKGFVGKDGKPFSTEQLVLSRIRKFNKVVCTDCKRKYE